MAKDRKNKKHVTMSKKELIGKVQLSNLQSTLKRIYCDEISLDTTMTCKCVCCKVAMPQMNYSEFIQIVTTIWNEWNVEDKTRLILSSLEYYFKNDFEKWGIETLVKPCMLQGNDGLCKIYENRSLSCFLPDTWVFTSNGPKYIKDIMAGDKVVGIDGNYHTVISTRSKIHNGKIYNVKTRGNNIDCWVTGDHLWYTIFHKDKRVKLNPQWTCTYDLISKEKGKKGNYLSIPKNCVNNLVDLECIEMSDYVSGDMDKIDGRILPYTGGKTFVDHMTRSIPNKIIIDDDFLFMVGIYLAEGSSSSQSSSFSMHKNEKLYLDRIKIYLESLGVPSHFFTDRNRATLRVDSCLFARFMANICGKLSENKAINEKLFSCLSSKQLMKIYESWDIGDGRKTFHEKEFSTTSISLKLIMQMYMVLISNNIYPKIYKYRNKKRSFYNYDLHVHPVNFRNAQKGHGSGNIIDNNFVYTPLKAENFEEKIYNGAVYDLEVADVESFVTSSGIAHNCRMFGIWPVEEYEKRVDRFEKAYAQYGLTREDLPLYHQCPLVKRTDTSKDLTIEIVNGLYSKLDKLDKRIGEFSDLEIKQKHNYRTFHDFLMLKIFGEEWLSMLTTFMMAATKEQLVEQLEVLKDTVRASFSALNDKMLTTLDKQL